MMGWAEMAKCHLGVAKFKNGVERRGCRRRDHVAVDVMTIVGCVLWGAERSLPHESGSVNAGIMTTFLVVITRVKASGIYHPRVAIVN